MHPHGCNQNFRRETHKFCLNLAHDNKVSEVAFGRRGQSGIKSLLFGSVAGSLIQTSDIPITVVP